MAKKLKTADYTRRAVDRYIESKDRLSLFLEKGTKERIYNIYGNIKLSEYIQKLIDKDLKEKEDIKPVDSCPFGNIPFTRPNE